MLRRHAPGSAGRLRRGDSSGATSIGIDLRSAKVLAEGDLDFRGTLGVSKDAPVGFVKIRLRFDVDTDASEEQAATLLRLTERYCVVLQTLRATPEISARITRASAGRTGSS